MKRSGQGPSPKSLKLAYAWTIALLTFLVTYYAFLLTFRVWPSMPWASLAIFISPLLLFLYALARTRRPRTAAWLCFALNPYFCHAVLLGFSHDATLSTLGILESCTIAALFIASMLFGRWQGRTLAKRSLTAVQHHHITPVAG